MTEISKNHPTIASCGIDCGLCPRFYTKGRSRCPGCGGSKFSSKHPSCSILTCCVKKNNFEVCSECNQFPCSKMRDWDKGDSFVTHKVSLSNLKLIKNQGIDKFLKQQRRRIEFLKMFMKNFDEGRSKSFYCISCTLLPINSLEESIEFSNQKIKEGKIRHNDLKARSKILREQLKKFAIKEGIELKLRK
ncbi:DUF3795 domain-containing protein [Candidatus Dojkabacteria bacterium]|nr:DUF3795 domain-containing protein [Candidatus Dojkabacteria bacterium]